MAPRAVLVVASLVAATLAQPKPTTPLFVCGEDEKTSDPNPIVLRWENVVLAADGRVYSPCIVANHPTTHREVREAMLLLRAAVSPQPEFRRLAAQAHGRTGIPAAITLLMRPIAKNPSLTPGPVSGGPTPEQPPALDDDDPAVRATAASGIGDLLSGALAEPHEGPPDLPTEDQLKIGRLALEARLRIESADVVAAAILETLGRLTYTDDGARNDVELELVARATGSSTQLLGAVKGLEALIRGNPRRPILPATRQKLRECAVIGPTLTAVPTIAGNGTMEREGDEERFARVRRLALISLQQVRDDDLDTVTRASRDADWQVRRLVAARIDPAREDHATLYETLSADPAFQVRYELIAAVSRMVRQTHDCAPLLKMARDPSIPVGLRAIDELPDSCAEPAPVVAYLTSLAVTLKDAAADQPWHLAAHAWVALARIDRAAARPLLDLAAAHGTWQVRASAAKAAGSLRDDATLVTLAADREPNVRTAALEALFVMKSPAVTAAAVRALGVDSDDHQLLMTAADVLKGTPAVDREDVSTALVAALARLTRRAADTSRDARKAILDRLGEVMPLEHAGLLAPYAIDVDPRIREAAAKAWEAVTGAAMTPASTPQHRYPLQPGIDQFQNLPSRALIKMQGGGTIEMLLLTRDAPVTVVRFVELVRAGYYTGLTFHRVVPNFVIQGGSPGANEYAGTDRFWRDELGLTPHTRGAVGLSTRGHDAGDGQFFIDLTDQPRLDHDYTVFARVISGLDVVDAVLEGARIESITFR